MDETISIAEFFVDAVFYQSLDNNNLYYNDRRAKGRALLVRSKE
jgi:hypothetical protein